MDLPDSVLAALRGGQKIEAIKLLREQNGIGLKEAKDIVDEYASRHESSLLGADNAALNYVAKRDNKIPYMGLLVIATFVWAMINFVEVVGSIIVLWHHKDYQQVTFTISKIHYDDDHEAGLTWGFIGRLPEGEARMYAPKLADATALGYSKLRKIYPQGMEMKVWYNPSVTSTLFQHRTLGLIPYTPDLVKSEMTVVYHWLFYCLLPFVVVLVIARVRDHSRS